MSARILRSLLVTLFVLSNGWSTLQTPLARNYSQNLLRYAKSAEMVAYINPDFEFCDDFYKFSCGNWKRTHPATSNVTKTSYLGQIQELYVRKSIDMLKGDKRQAERSFHQKLKDFFESCSNEVALVRSGLEPVIKVVNFRGGWPRIVDKTWYMQEYDWLRTIAELRGKLGVDILVGLEIIPAFDDKDINRIKIGAPKLHLGSKAAYIKSSYGDEREEYMDSIAKKLRKYFNYMPANWAYEVARQVLDIERALARGLPDNAALTVQQSSRKRYVSELKEAYGSFVDLNKYLTLIFNQTILTPVYEVPEDYLSNLVDVIRHESKLHLANYTMWRVLEALDFAGAINEEHNDNWCVARIAEYFPNQLEDMFYSHFNSIPLHNELLAVWKDIKGTFQEELKSSANLNWMTQDTRNKAIDKLTQMTLNVEEHDHNALEYEMIGLNFDRYKYYENLLQVLKWHTRHQLAELNNLPKNKQQREYKLPTYVQTNNQVRIPIVFMQSRFLWDPAYPHALKYSTLGVLLAQQMLHGFDDEGRKHDKHGYQRSWWEPTSEAAYDKRAECLIHQYENQKFRSQHVFEERMISDIVTFNGALGIAFRTYQSWKSKTPDSIVDNLEALPKLYYRPEQLFFIGFAQMWCADYESEVKKFTELPERLRVNSALANLPDFANELSCHSNTKLNPLQKCIIY